MPSRNAISIDKLARLIGTSKCPARLDLRPASEGANASRLIKDALSKRKAHA